MRYPASDSCKGKVYLCFILLLVFIPVLVPALHAYSHIASVGISPVSYVTKAAPFGTLAFPSGYGAPSSATILNGRSKRPSTSLRAKALSRLTVLVCGKISFGFLSGTLGLLFNPLGQAVGWIAWLFSLYALGVIKLFAKLPFAIFEIHWHWIVILIYYFILVFVLRRKFK